MKFRPDIEGLRAVAVTLVLLAHLGVSGFKGGFVGVDIFFVISGYLITGLITAEFAKKEALEPKSGWVSLRAFYFRRVKRIIPVSFFILTVTTIASFILLNSIRAKEVLNDSIWAALFGANIHFIRIATDYFQQGAATSPVQHYWSLAVEEQFYLVIPALFILAVNIIRLRIIPTRASWKFRIRFLFSLIVLLSFIWSIVATSSSPASAYFSSLTRAWELGVGALLAVGTFERPSRIKSRYLLLFALAGIALFAFSTLAFSASVSVGMVPIMRVQANGDTQFERTLKRRAVSRLLTASGAAASATAAPSPRSPPERSIVLAAARRDGESGRGEGGSVTKRVATPRSGLPSPLHPRRPQPSRRAPRAPWRPRSPRG